MKDFVPQKSSRRLDARREAAHIQITVRKSLVGSSASTASHAEKHSAAGARFKELILGGQDGLVNVLGVILGIAAAAADVRLVIIAGLAAAFAESFSMAAVAYTSTKAEQDHYRSELARENREIDSVPEAERREIRDIYEAKGFSGKVLDDVVGQITSDRTIWLNIMMKEELGFSDIPAAPARSAAIVGLASMIGSLIPLAGFFVFDVKPAMIAGVSISAAALFVMGAVEGKMTVGGWLKKGLHLAAIGLGAALIGFAVGKILGAG